MPDNKYLTESGELNLQRLADDALLSQRACNPRALLHSLLEMLGAIADTGGAPRWNHPAVRLVLYQVRFLVAGVEDYREPWDEWNKWALEHAREEVRRVA